MSLHKTISFISNFVHVSLVGLAEAEYTIEVKLYHEKFGELDLVAEVRLCFNRFLYLKLVHGPRVGFMVEER